MLNNVNEKYSPPPGPPPDYSGPSQSDLSPAPYHNWQEAVPDTAVFPPPPIVGLYGSSTGNASSDDAERAHDFCDRTPLWTPTKPSAAVISNVESGNIYPVRPREFKGNLMSIGKGKWRGRTIRGNGDCNILTHLPLYFPVENSPIVTGRTKAIYFEVKILGLGTGPSGGTGSSGLAIGFVAQPYPTWRSPGWERGSLGVFSDDGCRFVNDSWGGKEFMDPLVTGDTIGLGMIFSLPDIESANRSGRKLVLPAVNVFCTRNGRRIGGWDVHEETDEESGSIKGLEGDFDLYGSIGLFGEVGFEACFDRSGWLYEVPAV